MGIYGKPEDKPGAGGKPPAVAAVPPPGPAGGEQGTDAVGSLVERGPQITPRDDRE